jgi:hypothetical protein
LKMKTTKTNLAKAVTLAIAGTALSIGAISTASAHVSYNTYQAADPVGGTDGWMWGGHGAAGIGAVSGGNAAAANPGWVGESDSNLDGNGDAPFGYTGAPHLNWAARLHSAGASLEVSATHAQTAYSTAVEVDTAAGAWLDNTGLQGWKHQTDVGLFKSMVTQNVTLTPTLADGTGFADFGITIFQGMATNETGYGHHGAWNTGGTFTGDNPWATTGLTYLTHGQALNGSNALTFTAVAGQVYSIYLGGDQGGHWNGGHESYVLDITSSPVPVPAAVWLFGTALAGLGVTGRRKKAAVA